MVSKSDKKMLLLLGGAVVAGYILLRRGEAAVTGAVTDISGALGAIPGDIQTGAAGLGVRT